MHGREPRAGSKIDGDSFPAARHVPYLLSSIIDERFESILRRIERDDGTRNERKPVA